MNNMLYFALTCLIVIISLYVILKIFINEFNPLKSKVKLYGMLKSMTTKEMVSVSCSLILYVFMLYIMFSFINLDWVIIAIVIGLTFISGILIKNKYVLIDVILSIVSLGGIKIVYLIHDYITNEYMSVWMLLLLVFVMIFMLLYLSYVLLKSFKAVIASNEYVRKGEK